MEQAAEQHAAFADENLQLAVRSAQILLDQVAGSLSRGDITAIGARGMLQVAKGIVEQAHTVKPMPETADLVVKLAWTARSQPTELRFGCSSPVFSRAGLPRRNSMRENRPANSLVHRHTP